jgi:hypothetical protein
MWQVRYVGNKVYSSVDGGCQIIKLDFFSVEAFNVLFKANNAASPYKVYEYYEMANLEWHISENST